MTTDHFDHRANCRFANRSNARLAATLDDRYRGRYDPEANYHRAMYYMSALLWLTGQGPRAILSLTELIADQSSTDRCQPQAHTILIRHAGDKVIAWCACNRWWGYAGPDLERAHQLYAAHVKDSTNR